jgi:hypothetical protein
VREGAKLVLKPFEALKFVLFCGIYSHLLEFDKIIIRDFL